MRDIANINDVDINNVRYVKVLFYVLLFETEDTWCSEYFYLHAINFVYFREIPEKSIWSFYF